MSVKSYSKSLMPKQDELRFQRVMLWQQFGHMSPPMADDTEGHALLALRAAEKWNSWADAADEAEKDKRLEVWKFDEAVKDLSSKTEWERLVDLGSQFNAAETLRKFCEGVGLRRHLRTDYRTPFLQLNETLRVALEIYRRGHETAAGTGQQ